MACIIAAPTSGSGKTLLSLSIVSWAISKGLTIQTFKSGPDYLDSQHLSETSRQSCRNLDLVLCGKEWVKHSFYNLSKHSELSLVEGVMGLFDGIGPSQKGSTAELAKFLKLPIILVVDASRQAGSIAALVKGFKDYDHQLQFAGIVLNRVNTNRHELLLRDALKDIGIKVLGCLPNDPLLSLPSKHLGLSPPHEVSDLGNRIEKWNRIALSNLDLQSIEKLLRVSRITENPVDTYSRDNISLEHEPLPIAIAQDEAFHFRYPETKDFLQQMGMPLIEWSPLNNEPIPKKAKGLIIPGGFPENHAASLSRSKGSINSLRDFYGKHPIYAECGGMLLLGRKIIDVNEDGHKMAGILPFNAKKGNLKIGYRTLCCTHNSLITTKEYQLIGHEFHYWDLDIGTKKDHQINYHKKDYLKAKFTSCWDIKGWGLEEKKEGWSNKLLHASWIHLHWPSSTLIAKKWISAVKSNRNN